MNVLNGLSALTPTSFEVSWQSPSNIAFVKYWGKIGHQIPANPSISMTLKECVTKTSVAFNPASTLAVDLTLEGVKQEKFAFKIQKYLESLLNELPWLEKISVDIKTSNTFPHGAGIASSASGLSAFALCLTDYIDHLSGEKNKDLFLKRASFLARLASGSACRSVYGGYSVWGECDFKESSNLYATPFEVHSELNHLNDSVLVISDVEKNVSSRAGHDRMHDHPFALARFEQAKKNFTRMISALKTGEIEEVGKILENEALSLHAMMLTSPSAYTLFKPNSIKAMELIWDFRQQSKIPLYFTLDAGPNLHLIYPEAFKAKIQTFIGHELSSLCVKTIHDERGEGPIRC